MSKSELIDRLQIAIGKPANKYSYPYARVSKENPTKGSLHIDLIDASKAAESVFELLKELNLYHE
jgi:hypothetical protein